MTGPVGLYTCIWAVPSVELGQVASYDGWSFDISRIFLGLVP